MKLAAPLALLLIASACESDEKKLQRLRSEETRALATAHWYQRIFDSLNTKFVIDSTSVPLEVLNAYADSAVQAQTKLDLARRDVNRFLR